MQFRHDFSNMEKEDLIRKKKERVPTKKELLNNLNQDNQKEIEKWADLKFYKKETYQSHQILEKLTCEKISSSPEALLLSQDEYLKLIFKNIINEALTEKLNEKIYLTDKTISSNDLMKLPIQDQIQILFKKASVLSFEIILSLLGVDNHNNYLEHPKQGNLIDSRSNYYNKAQREAKFQESKISENQVLELILNYAHILKSGNLILKSEVKYEYVTDPKNREFMIKQRNTIIQFLQNNSQNGIKKNYFSGSNEIILNEVLNESCENVNGHYFLRESIFSKSKCEEFKNKYKEIYLKGISYWQNFQYDLSIKLNYVSDEQILKQIEESKNKESNQAEVSKKRKLSSSYANLGVSLKKEDSKLKAPLNLSKNNHSSKDLFGESDYKVEKDMLKNEVSNSTQQERKKNADKYENNQDIKQSHINSKDKKEEKAQIDNQNGKGIKEKLMQIDSVMNQMQIDINETTIDKLEAKGINVKILKESLLNNYSYETPNKKTEMIKKIIEEFPYLQTNPNTNIVINSILDDLFLEIRENMYLKEIDDKEANKVWKILLEMFSKGSSYKKIEIKKALGDQNLQITDQNLNKLLKKIAIYSNLSWHLKE